MKLKKLLKTTGYLFFNIFQKILSPLTFKTIWYIFCIGLPNQFEQKQSIYKLIL